MSAISPKLLRAETTRDETRRDEIKTKGPGPDPGPLDVLEIWHADDMQAKKAL